MGDKRVFYVYHLEQLNELCARVATCGFPIEVEDRHADKQYWLDSLTALNAWLTEHHPRTSWY